jgi:hypothetical protein
MTYIVINTTNAYDPSNQVEFATELEADAKAREILSTFPQSIIRTAKLLKTYTATVSISTTVVAEAGAEETTE